MKNFLRLSLCCFVFWLSGCDVIYRIGNQSDAGTGTGTGTVAVTDAELITHGGCADVYVFARSENNDIELVFNAPPVLQAAAQANGTLSQTFNLAGPTATLLLYKGQDLTIACDDVANAQEFAATKLKAIRGTALLTVKNVVADPNAGGELRGNATLQLEDVYFENGAGGITLPKLLILDVLVGWRPG